VSWRAALRSPVGLWTPVAGYMALIFVLSGQPDPPLPSQVSAAQGHSLGYMGLAVTVGRALAGGGRWWMIPMLAVLAVAGALLTVVAAIEYVAPFVYTIF